MDMATTQTATQPLIQSRGFQRGLLSGFVPLALLLGVLLFSLALTLVVRGLLASADFATQGLVQPLVFGAGLLLGIVLFVVTTVLTFRRIGRWRQSGETERAIGALWALGITAVLLLLPFVLAFVLPQSPAVAG
jgi:hypothetical protein